MKNITPFQFGLLAVFVILFLVGLWAMAGFRGKNSKAQNYPTAEIWGTVDSVLFDNLVKSFDEEDGVKVNYTEKTPEEFNQDLIEALADGVGPDAVLLAQDGVIRYTDKLVAIPYENIPERTFRDVFVEESELFLSPEGVLAYPLLIDPLVMYWNRDIFGSAGLANPPKFWDEFLLLPEKLTVVDRARNVVKSAVALGTFGNILNAKDILSAMFLQSGVTIVGKTTWGYSANLSAVGDPAAAGSVIRFYTGFADPGKPIYSWNSGLRNSRDAFTAADVGIYFGFASELSALRAKNPNLNFDAAIFPQSRDAKFKITFGRMYGLASLRSSRNLANTYRVFGLLIDKDHLATWAKETGLPPVRRDLLAPRPSDPYLAVFYDSALFARGWFDPNAAATREIFKTMIDTTITGQAGLSEAIDRANKDLDTLLSSYNKGR